MTRDEWHRILATELATSNQRGAVMRELERLGLGSPEDRPERLTTCATLLGIGELASIKDLTRGQAGWFYRTLQGCHDRAELEALAEASAPAPAEPRVNLPDMIAALAAILRDSATWCPWGPPASGAT